VGEYRIKKVAQAHSYLIKKGEWLLELDSVNDAE